MERESYQRINFFLLILFFFIEVLDNYAREKGIYFTSVKYGVLACLLAVCCVEFYTIVRMKKENRIFGVPLRCILFICITFAILSAYYIIKNHGFVKMTIIGLMKIFLPAFMAYVILNTMKQKNIDRVLEYYLLLSVAAYIVNIGFDNFTIQNLKAINFIASYSPFESNFFSPAAFSLFLYFFFYNKKRWTVILSMLLVFFTFKRPMVASVLVTVLVARVVRKSDEIPKWMITVLKAGFVMAVWGYIFVMGGGIDDLLIRWTGVGINQLSMGRAWLLENLSYDFVSYGFGSAAMWKRSIEMDLIMFYMEMGAIGIVLYIHFLYETAQRKFYNVYLITLTLIEMLLCHFYDISFYWIILYLTMGCVSSGAQVKERVKRKKIHFVFGGNNRHA